MERQPCVYILTNTEKGTLYVGVTSDLANSVCQHKNKLVDGFTKKYDLDKLVYYELYESMEFAIAREKAIKNWKRRWKLEIVNSFNPEWNDLYQDII